ncbi:MAG: GAF domain-containing protein [Anaerolineae bacterium]|nr:GAF domain-containing protein [Anaerolineae bacterium]
MSEEITNPVYASALCRATRSVIDQQDLQGVFEAIVAGAAEALQAHCVVLYAVDVAAAQITHVAKGGADLSQLESLNFADLEEGLPGWAMRERQIAFSAKAMVIGDPRESPAVRRRRAEKDIGSYVVAPILHGEQILGLLNVHNTMAQPDFTAEDIALIETLADQAAVAIQNARLLAGVHHKGDLLAAGAEVSRIIAAAFMPTEPNLDLLLSQVATVVQERFALTYVGVYLLDPTGQWAVLRAAAGEVAQLSERYPVVGAGLVPALGADTQDRPYKLTLPLLGRQRQRQDATVLGVMTVGAGVGAGVGADLRACPPGAFSDEDIAVLRMFADQLATAIENIHLAEQSQRRLRELSVLGDLQQAFAEAHNLDTILNSAYEQISRVFDTKDFYIATYQEGRDEWTLAFQMAHGELQTPRVHKLGQGLTGYIIRNRCPLHLANLDENRAFMASQGLGLVGDEALSWLGVPLITSGRVVGVMAIESYEAENLFTPSDQDLLSTIALQVANALESNRLLGEVGQRAVQLQTAAEVARATSSILNLQELLERSVELIRDRFDYYYVGVFLADADRHWALLRAGTGEAGQRMLAAGHRLEVGGTSMIGACIQDAQARIALDVGVEAVRFDNPLLPETHSEMAVPLRRGDQAIGALTVQSAERGAFSQVDVVLMTTIADQLATALENARLFAESQRDAEEVNLLYRAASELNSSPDYAAILEALRQYTVLGETDIFASVERFDHPWTPDSPPAALSPLARWTNDIPPEAFDAHYLLALFGAAQLVSPDTPALISDLKANGRLDASARRFFLERFKAASLALIPLVAGGEWTGLLVAAYRQPHAFSAVEARILMNLAGQAAVALENRVRLEAISRKDVEQSALINNIPDTIYFKDMELRFTRVNPAQATMLGVDNPEQAVGKTDLDFFVGPSAESAWEDDLRVIRDGESIIGRLEHIVNREGQSRWFSATKIPMRDAAGRIIGLVGISSDVTELKTIQDAAQQRAAELQQAALISRTLSAILDTAELLPKAVTEIQERLGYPGVAIFLQDEVSSADDVPNADASDSEAAHWLLLRAAAGDRAAEVLVADSRLPLPGDSPAALCVLQREPQLTGAISVPLLVPQSEGGRITEIALPLLRGMQTLGALCIQSTTADAFVADDVAMLQTIADQLANALEISRLLTEADRNVHQLEAVVGTYTLESWREFLTKTQRSRGYRYRGFDLEVATEHSAESQQAWREGRPVVQQQSSGVGNGADAVPSGIEGVTTLAVPIRVREQIIGVLNVRSRGSELAPDALNLLEEAGSRLGQALETARLLEDTRARATREQLASTISGRVRAEVEVESLLERALRELSLALGVRRAAVELEVKE